MTLSELQNGDIFIHANCTRKSKKKFVVYGNAKYNSRHGRATRNCKNQDGEIVGKSCPLEVIKIGESIYANVIKKLFDNQQNTHNVKTRINKKNP